jgi:hypothetical protein
MVNPVLRGAGIPLKVFFDGGCFLIQIHAKTPSARNKKKMIKELIALSFKFLSLAISSFIKKHLF